MKIKKCFVGIIVFCIISWLVFHFFSSSPWGNQADTTFQDEPEAHALYDKMVETMRQAKSLYYEGDFKWDHGHCTYTIWMKKPNYFRVETVSSKGKKGGILIGDGNNLWIYWPNGRPLFSMEDIKDWQKTHLSVYMEKVTPIGKHSIGHEVVWLGAGMSMTVLDPSIFHGYTPPLHSYIDGVRKIGTEKIGKEECRVIEVSIMKHQRSWYLWLSKQDNLPRKLKEIVRVDNDIIVLEKWSKVKVDCEIPLEMFAWAPPEEWKQWQRPGLDDGLLTAGENAPDFELLSNDSRKIKLSDYRGKIVWLTFWRLGCPPCRKEIPYLETLYKKYNYKGLVILGYNFSDEKQFVVDFLKENSVTFPNISDSSDIAKKVALQDYNMEGVPLNYIIDRSGKIVAAWSGYKDGYTQSHEVLEKLGIR